MGRGFDAGMRTTHDGEGWIDGWMDVSLNVDIDQ
jgi:hypothetical protein